MMVSVLIVYLVYEKVGPDTAFLDFFGREMEDVTAGNCLSGQE